MVNHELNFPNELEYLQEIAYIASLKEQEQNQEWIEEQQKMIKPMRKPAKIKLEMKKPINARDEYFRQWSSYSYDSDLLIINGKGHYLV